MIIRFVKLEIRPEHADDFAAFFMAEADGIREWPGCLQVQAFRDSSDPSRFFTQSYWTSEAALDNYRASSFFRNNWSTVKAWFASPAQAWSTVALLPNRET